MKLWFIFIVPGLIGCQQTNPPLPATDQVRNQFVLIDGGSRRIEQKTTPALGGWATRYDTIPVSRGEMYRNQPEQHPLTPFYLSYSEWKTIQCVIAIDESDYWDKAMIGLIQKDERLRIRWREKDYWLQPLQKSSIQKGDWSCTYQLDSLRLQVRAHFKAEKILNGLTGTGTLEGHLGNTPVTESVFLVFD